MASPPLGNSSFVNLFPYFVYDNEQVAERSLDIWNSYRIRVLNSKNNDTAFNFHQLSDSDTYPSLAQTYYEDQRLWWLVPLANDAEDPFTFLADIRQQEQPIVRILKPQYIGDIIYEITNAREFAQSLYNRNGEDF